LYERIAPRFALSANLAGRGDAIVGPSNLIVAPRMVSQVFTIAKNTFVEATRQPIVLFLLMISGVLQVFNTWNTGFSMGYASVDSAEVKSDTKLLFDIGLSTVFGIGVLLAAFVATSAISREIENKTVLTVISKPISRITVVLGKYLGVAALLLMSSVVMLAFLLIAVRHGVMETAADDPDMPVIIFSLVGITLVLGLAAWGNFFYGWNFPQTSVMLLVPATLLVYLGVLLFSKKWELQPLSKDFLPQVVTACAALTLAILVMAAVATAASTRLGQVMTIVVCVGFFVAALMSNFFLGRHVFKNQAVAIVDGAMPQDASRNFIKDQEPLVVRLNRPLPRPIAPGSAIYFSSSPNGFPGLHLEDYRVNPDGMFEGDVNEINDVKGQAALGPGLFARSARDQELVVINAGAQSTRLFKAPEKGDYVFLAPTKIQPALLAVWGAIPNLQYFWLLDAVSQNRPVPVRYLLLSVLYAGVQIVGCLCVAVILFQRRDVG